MGIPRQADMFDGMPPKSHHAERLNSDAVICQKVKAELARRGLNGAMVEEVADALRMTCSQVQSAMSELKLFGEARKTEVKRRSRTGGWGSVYIIIARK